MVCASASSFIGTFFISLSFEYSIYAGINQGVISTLFVLESVIAAYLAFIVMKERISIQSILGMILLIICAGFLSFSSHEEMIANVPI